MSDLPYLCHFRIIIHIRKTDKYDDDETLEIQTWADYEDFMFRSKKQFEKDKKDLSYWLKQSEGSDKIKFSKGTHGYLKTTLSNSEIGEDLLKDSDIIERIIEHDIKPKGDKYYEITGKLHFSSFQTYYGDWDCDEDVSNLKFQEIAEEDVQEWLKDNEGKPNE